MKAKTDFAVLLSQFFTTRLTAQLRASAHTILSYKHTFRLLALYLQDVLQKPPQKLTISDLSVEHIVAFLKHLEQHRHNSVATRNVRLAAIRCFFHYVALQEPQYAFAAQQIQALPIKRGVTRVIDFLEHEETQALLKAPDLNTWTGLRDYALLLVAVQTGMRASEIIGLRHADVQLGCGAHVRCLGKGRKARCISLRSDTVAALKAWVKQCPGEPDSPLFVNQRGRVLNHDSLDYLLKKNLAVARQTCVSLQNKKITPHCLRHTAAMNLLRSGADRVTIALWLGHEQVETTYIYLHADLELKERAMAKTTPSNIPIKKFQPEDEVLAMLNSL